ncbi:Bug family tripartite tricarboxylate transporter substrate binding protein [Telmatospirillum siberiense]|nr:tripartite tricarboxylate transporter substrate binding protein [Telmatospirillum siberiense]
MEKISKTRRKLLALSAAGLFGAISGIGPQARARPDTPYPSRAVKVVIPYLAGGPNDITTRILTQNLSAQWGTPVIVENRPGANGTIGTMAVKNAPPDGYTLLSGATFLVLNPLIEPQPQFKIQDFVPIGSFGTPPNLIVVANDSPWTSLEALVAAGQANPGSLRTPHAGIGSSVHLGISLFLKTANIQALVVPYKGSPPYVIDLLGGRLDFAYLSAQLALPQIQAGKLRALATVSDHRLADLPAIRTLAEIGYPGGVVLPWSGLFALAEVPGDIVDRIRRDIGKALADPTVAQQYRNIYAEIPADPAALPQLVSAEQQRWQKVVQDRLIDDL